MICLHFARFNLATPFLLAFGLCILGFVGSTQAQETVTPELQTELEQVQKNVDLFFRNFVDKGVGIDRALRDLLVNSPLKDRREAIAALTQQAGQLEKQYGGYLGHERVAFKAYGTDLIVVRYLFKCERYPVVWHFYFYRPSTASLIRREWTLVELRIDASLSSLEK